jgi:murein DD-endopeptidase MepM/ murein hydrolase activator NlpD
VIRRVGSLTLALVLSGCIPPSADRPDREITKPINPRIEPDMAGIDVTPQVWEAHPAEGNVIDVPGGTYTIQPGDTLRSIGIKTGVGWETLARVNQLDPPYTPPVGTQLTIPAGRYHIVKAGESGIAIAKAHGVHWSEIVALNGLAEPYVIHTDQRLMLPAGRAESAHSVSSVPVRTLSPDLEARAAAFNLDDVVAGGGEPAQDLNTRHAAREAHDRPTPQRPLAPTTPVAPPSHFAGGGFSWPLNGSVVGKFGAGGGQGINITAPSGSLIFAAANGVTAFVGNVANYGGAIIITHGDGWMTVYSHIAKVSVTRGTAVHRGQVIGITGGEGGGRLHFEIRQHKTPIDPQTKLS